MRCIDISIVLRKDGIVVFIVFLNKSEQVSLPGTLEGITVPGMLVSQYADTTPVV